jgi:hypothetical protein
MGCHNASGWFPGLIRAPGLQLEKQVAGKRYRLDQHGAVFRQPPVDTLPTRTTAVFELPAHIRSILLPGVTICDLYSGSVFRQTEM